MCISLSLALSPEFPVCTLNPSLFLKRVAFVLSNVFNDVLLSKTTRQAMSYLMVFLDLLGSCLSSGPLSVGVPLWASFDVLGWSPMSFMLISQSSFFVKLAVSQILLVRFSSADPDILCVLGENILGA